MCICTHKFLIGVEKTNNQFLSDILKETCKKENFVLKTHVIYIYICVCVCVYTTKQYICGYIYIYHVY